MVIPNKMPLPRRVLLSDHHYYDVFRSKKLVYVLSSTNLPAQIFAYDEIAEQLEAMYETPSKGSKRRRLR